MKQSEGEQSPACGYGLLGLCCSACLFAPCRLSPFEGESQKGLCGDDRDLIVAKNLLRLVNREAAWGIRDLRETVARLGRLESPALSQDQLKKEEGKKLAQKYGLSSHVTGRDLIHFFLEESKAFLFPFSKSKNSLLLSLCPGKAFPFIYEGDLPSGSMMSLFLDSVHSEREGPTGVEGILRRCIQTSLLLLISQEFQSDLTHFIPEEEPVREKMTPDPLANLPPQPGPVTIILSDGDSPFCDRINHLIEELKQTSKTKPPLLIQIKEAGSLLMIGRGLFEKWSLPVSEGNVLALISSSSVTPTLGALGLGFTVASFPPLPIHGSERVERFFLEEFKKKFGNTYLSSWQEDVSSPILEFLRGTA